MLVCYSESNDVRLIPSLISQVLVLPHFLPIYKYHVHNACQSNLPLGNQVLLSWLHPRNSINDRETSKIASRGGCGRDGGRSYVPSAVMIGKSVNDADGKPVRVDEGVTTAAAPEVDIMRSAGWSWNHPRSAGRGCKYFCNCKEKLSSVVSALWD